MTTRGYEEVAFVDVCLVVEGLKPLDSFAGKRVEISDQVYAEITAVTIFNDPRTDSASYSVHATLSCNSSLRYSLESYSWEYRFLVSSSLTESKLRDFFDILPSQPSILQADDLRLLP
jgi:hypothetical protein